GLSCVQGLEVVPSGSILYIQPAGKGNRSGRDPIQQLARQTGAGTIVSGAYYLEADSLRFQARIDDVAHGRLLMALAPATCARGAPLQAIDALRQRVMGAVAARLESVHEMGTQQQPPRYDAYCEFIAGFEIFETDEREGLKHFQRASALDRDFLPPLFYEAYLLDRLGDHARVGEILRTLSEQREDLLPFGRQWLDVMLAYASHRYPEALQHARLALRKAPGDPMTTLWVGFMAAVSNRPREVIETFRRFGPRPYPDQQLGANWMVHLCGALHRLGEHRRELDEAHRARVQYPAQADLWEIEADALAALGRVRELNRLVDERLLATPAGGAPEDMMLEAADELRAHGRREASIGLANRVLSRFRSRPPAGGEEDSLAGLVQALRRAERWSEAAATCRALAARLPQNPDYLGMLGALEARLGRRDEAARIDEELRALKDPYLFGAHTFRRACIAALLGDRMRAVDLLRTSLAEGKPFGVAIHREMDLETLWDYGPYQALMRPQG
ncbi:MAG TPA: hypothetical protein VMS88_01875, partial [Terriglobales bacterium]|nr:hypothetical protein [Terriglobales bacterium]